MEKWIAGFLQAGSAFLFFAAGAFGDDGMFMLVPAAISGVSGLLLWSRDRKAPEAIVARREPAPLEVKVDRIENTLALLQGDLTQLQEDREFFSELYAQRGEQRELTA